MKGDFKMNGKDFLNITPLRACFCKVIPLVYDDCLSYLEQLAKIVKKLNELIANNELLPDYIKELIKEYVTGDEFEQILSDILLNYILNVKYPPNGLTPAIGNGTADDTLAVQGCIDYASENGYGVVYIPYGKYLVNGLNLKSNVSLTGFDRYSTTLVLKGGTTVPLLKGNNVTNVGVYEVKLDGNSGIQVNDVNLTEISGSNVELSDLIIGDCFRGFDYTGNGGHLQADNLVFGNTVENCASIKGTSTVQFSNTIFNNLSAVGGVSVLDIQSSGGSYNFISNATCEKCVVVSGNRNKISATIKNSIIPITDSGEFNNLENVGESVSVNISKTSKTKAEKIETVTNEIEHTTEIFSLNSDVININSTASNVNGESETRNVKEIDIQSENISVKSINEITVETNKINIVAETEKHIAEEIDFEVDDFIVKSVSPITYKEPQTLSEYFKTIPMKDYTGSLYNVLVETDRTKNLPLHTVTPEMYGAVGDNVTDDTLAIQNMFNSNPKYVLFLSGKTYLITNQITIENECTIDGYGSKIHRASSATRRNVFYVTGDGVQINGLVGVSENDKQLMNGGVVFPGTVTSNITFVYLDASKFVLNNVETYNMFSLLYLDDVTTNTPEYIACYNVKAFESCFGVFLNRVNNVYINGIYVTKCVSSDDITHHFYVCRWCNNIVVENFDFVTTHKATLDIISVHPSDLTEQQYGAKNVLFNNGRVTADVNNYVFTSCADRVVFNNVKFEHPSTYENTEIRIIRTVESTNVVFENCEFSSVGFIITEDFYSLTQNTTRFLKCIINAEAPNGFIRYATDVYFYDTKFNLSGSAQYFIFASTSETANFKRNRRYRFIRCMISGTGSFSFAEISENNNTTYIEIDNTIIELPVAKLNLLYVSTNTSETIIKNSSIIGAYNYIDADYLTNLMISNVTRTDAVGVAPISDIVTNTQQVIKYNDFTVTLNSTAGSYISIATGIASNNIRGAVLLTNSNLNNLVNTDGLTPILSIDTSGNLVILLHGGNTMETERLITVRVYYI